MSRTIIVPKDAVTVGKTIADATAVDVDNVAGCRLYVPAGSPLAGLTIKVHEVGPDDANYVAKSSLTNDQMQFTLAAGESIDLDPAGNLCTTLKFVCDSLTPTTAQLLVRGKRQS